jgi:hypothetical protein
MTTAPSLPPHDLPAAAAAVLFARTHEGVLVAKLGDNAFAMLSGSGGPAAASSATTPAIGLSSQPSDRTSIPA